MEPLDYIAAGAAGWLVLGALGGASWALIARPFRAAAKPEPEIVHRIPVLRPVPPSRIETDLDWLDMLPVDSLSSHEVALRFDRIVGAA